MKVTKIIYFRNSSIFWILLIVIFLSLRIPILLEYPLIWPDEAWIGDVSSNIMKTGKPTTEIWGVFMPGSSEHFVAYPPFFLYLLAFWFKFLGITIINQRILSLIISAAFIVIFYFFSKFFIKNEFPNLSEIRSSFLAFLGSLLLIVDPTFFKSSVISRPEVLVLLLITCFLWIIIKTGKLTSIGGLLVGFILLTHFLAGLFLLVLIIYHIFTSPTKFFLKKENCVFIILALLPVVIWLFLMLPDLDILKSQLRIFSEDRNLSPRWLSVIFTQEEIADRISFLIYLLVSLIFFIITLISKKIHFLLISLLFAAAWVITYFGKIEWYSVYIVPFNYLSLIILFVYSDQSRKKTFLKDIKYLTILVTLILLVIGLNNSLSVISNTQNNSYLEFKNKVKSVIPEGKAIFISSFPDTYFAFKPDGRYKVFEQPFYNGNLEVFKNLLKQIDFIIVNAQLPNMILDNELNNYIQNHTYKKITVSGGGYTVFVIELKPEQTNQEFSKMH